MGDMIRDGLKKILGGKDPVDNFVPEIVPSAIKTPKEMAQAGGKSLSVSSALQSVVPIDPAKTIGSIQTEVAETAISLTPENVIGSGGPVSVPEIPKFGLKNARSAISSGPKIPGLGNLSAPSGVPKPEKVIFAPINMVKSLADDVTSGRPPKVPISVVKNATQ